MSLNLKSNVHQIKLISATPPVSRVYEFEGFSLEAEHLMLYRNDEELSFTPKQVETLLALIERRGEIVSKDALMARLWGHSAVEESNLIQNIHLLRKVLGEARCGKPMIETFRRRGYRFNGEVKGDEPSPETSLSSAAGHPAWTTSSGPTTWVAGKLASTVRSWTRTIIAIAVVMSLIALIPVSYLVYRSGTSTGAGKRSVAVLPLKPIDSKFRDELYELGIAEAMIHLFSSAGEMNVKPLSATRKYVDLDQDPVAAGRELRVNFVISSSFQVVNNKIRVTSQLINVSSGRIEETFQTKEIDTDNVFDMQDRIAADLGAFILFNDSLAPDSPSFWWSVQRHGFIRGPFIPFTEALGTENEEAYRSYLIAQNFIEMRGLDKGRKALEHIQRAVELDPNFARAWATKAYIHRYIGYGPVAHEQYRLSMEAVEKALVINPNLSEAHSALCFNKFRYEYDFAGAESECRRALELDSNSPLAHKVYSNFLYTRGRFDESITEIKRAMEIQPVSYDNQQTYALALYYARRYSESEAEWKRLIDLNPDHSMIYGFLSDCLVHQGKESEALDYRIKEIAVAKGDDREIVRLKAAYAASGWQGVTLERIKITEAEAVPDLNTLARSFASVGNKDKAFEYLEKAYQQRSNMIAVLGVDPRLDSLRDDPRYADLLRRVESENER